MRKIGQSTLIFSVTFLTTVLVAHIANVFLADTLGAVIIGILAGYITGCFVENKLKK